jgi:hypothetical protein
MIRKFCFVLVSIAACLQVVSDAEEIEDDGKIVGGRKLAQYQE